MDDYRVLLVDQRGTGRSAPATRQTLPARGDAAAQANYLSHFRADSIVRDCEALRRQLLGEGEQRSFLGQSYGGFCAVTYLSFAPQGLRRVLITGGLPGLRSTADDVYRAAFPRIERKNLGHYPRYPEDIRAVRGIVGHLRSHEVTLPGGGRLTAEAFQALGLILGSGNGSHTPHYLIELAFVPGSPAPMLSDSFLWEVQQHLSFAGNPLYAVLHEAAELLAQREQWPDLYDSRQLAANEVPVVAIYHDDMYVDTADSLATARAIRGLRTWVTDESEHDGLRVSGGRVLDRLVRLVHGDL